MDDSQSMEIDDGLNNFADDASTISCPCFACHKILQVRVRRLSGDDKSGRSADNFDQLHTLSTDPNVDTLNMSQKIILHASAASNI